jgi:hypothetical protein
MLRASLLVALSLSLVTAPLSPWWATASSFVLTAFIGARLESWLGKRKRPVLAFSLTLDRASHPHYCQTCDRQWRHDGATCVRHWAAPCPECDPADALAGRPTRMIV